MARGDLDDYSDSDDDDDLLLSDIRALSKACLHTAPGDAFDAHKFDSLAVDSSDSDDDFELLRDVQAKYGGGGGVDSCVPSSPRPNFGLPIVNSDSDDEDDFEILRAIQRRFGQYSASGTNCGGVEEPEGMVSNDDLNSLVNEILEARVGEGIDGNEEGLCDSAPNLETLCDDVENQPSELPKAALAFIDAIRKNRLAQKHLRSQMTKVEARMEKVKEMIKGVKIISEFDVQGRRKMTVRRLDDRVKLISVANKSKKVASAMKKGPKENSRVVNYRTAFSEYPQWIAKETWKKRERENLRKGLIQQLQRCLLLKSMDQMNESEEGPGCSYGVDEVMSKIGDLKNDPETYKRVRSFLPNVDWEDLASTYVPKRSGRECLARWINFEDPLIKKDQDQGWTSLEDKCLLHYIQNLGHNWAAVAEALGTDRTPFQCLTRYQRSLNPSLIKRDWTPAEDANLTAAVQIYGESNWTVVASVLEGRTGPQCSNRWLKTLLPSKQRKGRWNPDEDKRLKIAVMIMGSQCWNKIAEFVPGRTQSRCRDRWVNSLDPYLNLGKWTEREDAKLEEAIRVHGYCWAKVATCVPPRTDNQCRRRWVVLFPDEALRAQAQRKVEKAALPSNFVDREPNRPSLRATDFIPLALENTQVEDAGKGKKRSTRGKKSWKISDAAFCNIPKKPRSSRRCRRVDVCWEVPVLHLVHSSETIHMLPCKRRRVRGSGFKRNKCAENDLTLADLMRSLKEARKKRKRGENETKSQGKHAEVQVQRESSVNRDEDAGSVCTSGSVVKCRLSSGAELDASSVLSGEEHQQEDSSVGSGSELVNCYGDSTKHHDMDETIVNQSDVTRKHPKRRKRVDPVEPEGWENVPLATLFGKTTKLRKKL